MAKKIKIAVVYGGKSSEHEVSIDSARMVLKNIDTDKYIVNEVYISKSGCLNISQILEQKPDLVFLVVHGVNCEDGTVQGLFDHLGIKYTGSGIAASSIGFNKILFRKMMKSENLPIPKYVVVDKKYDLSNIRKSLGRFPYFVKPVSQGSSVGAAVARNERELVAALKVAFKYGDLALVDEYIDGLELTCGVLGNTNPKALPITEIHPLKNTFFDYASKYSDSGATEIAPARISDTLTKKTQKIAVDVYKSLGCRGFARVDFILKNNKTPVILEINTIPGLTKNSLLPKCANAAGIGYSELIDKVINYAIEK